jgi:hypothetical protein
MIPIRSYRVCFDLERRIHQIDRWRIPLPYGVPLAGIGWAGAALLAIIVLSRLPLVGALLGGIHPAVRYIVLPVAIAWFLTRWRIDGRSAHASGMAWLRWQAAPRQLVAFRRTSHAPGEMRFGAVTLVPDERGARLRSGTVRGPGRALLRYPVEFRERGRGRTLVVKAQEGDPLWRGKEVTITSKQRMVIAP